MNNEIKEKFSYFESITLEYNEKVDKFRGGFFTQLKSLTNAPLSVDGNKFWCANNQLPTLSGLGNFVLEKVPDVWTHIGIISLVIDENNFNTFFGHLTEDHKVKLKKHMANFDDIKVINYLTNYIKITEQLDRDLKNTTLVDNIRHNTIQLNNNSLFHFSKSTGIIPELQSYFRKNKIDKINQILGN